MNDTPDPRPRRGVGKAKKADGSMITKRYSAKEERTQKNRAERRAARIDPETQPTYGRYSGYVS